MARALVPGKVLIPWLLILAVAATVTTVLPAQLPPSRQPPPGPATPPAPPANPLDEPISWLSTAQHNYRSAVKNYTCTLVKKEKNSRNAMQEQHVIMFSSRVQPFSVHMKWISPPKMKNQEVIYVQGRHDGKMRVRPAKAISVVTGFISVDVNDRRAREYSKHTILDAGLGNMIDTNLKNLQLARQIGKTKVRTAEYKYDNRICIRVETWNNEYDPRFYCFRSILFLEKESKIPIRLENYEWPVPGGNREGELMEEFNYVGLDFNNPNFRDEIFNK